jgi:hypothetical protein
MSLLTDGAVLLDPVLLARAAGFELDDWQARVLRTLPRRLLLNCSRQAGKSLCASLLAVYQAIYEPGSLTVVVAVAQRQAAETIRVCRDIYAALDRPEPTEAENKLSLELANGSRILSVPSTEATIRGLSKVGLLVLDEASRIPDALYAAVLPFLAISDGRLALLSTPFGRRGFFFDAYKHKDEWYYEEVKAAACPRIDPEFLAEQRRKTGEFYYAQEWECAFNDATTGAFRSEDIDRAVKSYPTWNLRQYMEGAEEHHEREHEREREDSGADDVVARTWQLGAIQVDPWTPQAPVARPQAVIDAEIQADAVWRTGMGLGARWSRW